MKLLKYVLQFTKLEDYFTMCLKFDEQKEQQDRDNKKICPSDGWKSIFDQDVLNIYAKQAKSRLNLKRTVSLEYHNSCFKKLEKRKSSYYFSK